MIPSTRTRVTTHTPSTINRAVQQKIEDNLQFYANHADKIDARLRELDHEWDVERAIEMNASALAFIGVALGARDKRFLALPALVTGFLFQHAIQGWCPPIPILRRLGFRTAQEIEQERYALKVLRGDFGRALPPRRALPRTRRAAAKKIRKAVAA